MGGGVGDAVPLRIAVDRVCHPLGGFEAASDRWRRRRLISGDGRMAVTIELEREMGDPVMGIDEAGRGPLVGGVYAGAVLVPLALAETLLTGAWRGINDSKKLSEKKR